MAPRQARLHDDLRKFPITKGCLVGIGDARLAQLNSFGLTTAADIDLTSIIAVPGFGATMADSLIAWRKQFERSFRFNFALKPAPSAMARATAAARQAAGVFATGLRELRSLASKIEAAMRIEDQRWQAAVQGLDPHIQRIGAPESDIRVIRVLGGRN